MALVVLVLDWMHTLSKSTDPLTCSHGLDLVLRNNLKFVACGRSWSKVSLAEIQLLTALAKNHLYLDEHILQLEWCSRR